MSKTAVVTGGSSGIGAAIARALGERGWRLLLLARGQERLEQVAAELDAEWELCDVADRAAVEAAAERIGARHSAIQLLVNNAGVPAGGRYLELEPERIEQVLRINYLGSVWCLRAFLPLLEAGRPATVVNIASVAGTTAYGTSGPYAASKSAQLSFSRSIGVELAPRGIGVLTVNPGLVATPGFPQCHVLRYPLGERVVLRPEQVATAVLAALERGSPELVVPWPYRVAGAVQGVAPATLSRVLTRWARRRA